MLLDKDIKEILFSREEIDQRCQELGKALTSDYKDKTPLVIGILKGSLPFMENLLDYFDVYCTIDYIVVSSYQGTQSTGLLNIVKDVSEDVKGKDILLVEDIVDSGLTLTVVKNMFMERGAKSIKVVTLLDKPSARKYQIDVEYRAFEVQNQFVVGFGLDYNQYYRNLPYVGILKEEVYEKRD